MASKNARKKRNACKGKVHYASIDEAKKAIIEIYKKKESVLVWKLSPYYCEYCKGIHIGHRPHKHACK